MLQDYKAQNDNRLQVSWPGWMFSAAHDEVGNVNGLHDQTTSTIERS
jgi:hypothetical protein